MTTTRELHNCKNDDCWLDVTNEECLEKMLASAREQQRKADCAAVCSECRKGDMPDRIRPGAWLHTMLGFDDRSEDCTAGPIHELHHQEQAQSAATIAPDSPKGQNP